MTTTTTTSSIDPLKTSEILEQTPLMVVKLKILIISYQDHLEVITTSLTDLVKNLTKRENEIKLLMDTHKEERKIFLEQLNANKEELILKINFERENREKEFTEWEEEQKIIQDRIDADRDWERKKWEEEHKIIREQINASKVELMLQINFERERREKEINFILEQNNRKLILQQISIKEK